MPTLKELLTPTTIKKIDAVNQRNLKAVPSGGTIDFVSVKGLVFIGNHPYPEAKAVQAAIQKDSMAKVVLSKGKIEVKREAIAGKGVLKVTPAPQNQAEFKSTLQDISKKAVVFK